MSAEIITWIWLIVGLLLCGAEVVLPGLVSIFLGLAAVLVAGLRFVGILDGLPASLIVWMVSSVALVLVFRRFAARLIPSETSDENFDEDRDYLGVVVEVTDEISEHHETGRIRFQGTSWAAKCVDGTIAKGTKARIIYRDNLIWVVEPATPQMGELPAAQTPTVPKLQEAERAELAAQAADAANPSTRPPSS